MPDRNGYAPPSYAVVWREEDSTCVGELTLAADRLLLEGTCRGGLHVVREVLYKDIAGARIGRTRLERIDGRLSLVIQPRLGDDLFITNPVGVGTLHELAERLNSLALGDPSK